MLRIKPLASATEMLAVLNSRLDAVDEVVLEFNTTIDPKLTRDQVDNVLSVLAGHFYVFDPGPKAVRYVLERNVSARDAFSALETLLSWSVFTPFVVQDFINATTVARAQYEQAKVESQKAR